MHREIVLDETIETVRPLHEVFAYVSDLAHMAEWDPAVALGERLSEGPLAVGSRFKITMNSGLELIYTVREWDAPQRILMDVASGPFSAVEEISFAPLQVGTRVRYVARFSFSAPWRQLAQAFPGVMDRVGKAALAGMKRALDDQFAPPALPTSGQWADRLVLPGLARFTRFGYRSARRRWNPLSAYVGDRHFVITGATSGLGLATAEALAARGAELTLVARDGAKARQTADALVRNSGNERIRVELADLSLLRDVNALADRLLEKQQPIHGLINNAGALFNPRQETDEGFEKSFALLLASPALLTERLHPLLTQAAAPGRPARVVNVLSGGMYAQKIRPGDLQSAAGTYSGSEAYARAKRGLMILTQEWAQRWAHDGISVNAMHPGWADTPGVVDALPGFYRLTSGVLRTPQEGADTIVWLAVATEAGQVSGQFWFDREPHAPHLLGRTVESEAERQAFLSALERILLSSRQATVGRDTARP